MDKYNKLINEASSYMELYKFIIKVIDEQMCLFNMFLQLKGLQFDKAKNLSEEQREEINRSFQKWKKEMNYNIKTNNK